LVVEAVIILEHGSVFYISSCRADIFSLANRILLFQLRKRNGKTIQISKLRGAYAGLKKG